MRLFILGVSTGFLIGPLLATVIMLLGFWPIAATAQPPIIEAKIARRTLDASVSHAASKLKNPLPSSNDTIRAGMKLCRENCAGCHGQPGKPSAWGTTSFYPRVPQFADEPPNKPDWQLFWIVKNGVRYSGMGAWGGLASDEKIWELTTFLSHLRNLPPDVRAEWVQETK
jgi:mono/diheme cytochrome c family protein